MKEVPGIGPDMKEALASTRAFFDVTQRVHFVSPLELYPKCPAACPAHQKDKEQPMKRPLPPSIETPGPRRPIPLVTLAEWEVVIRRETAAETRHLCRLSRVGRLRKRG